LSWGQIDEIETGLQELEEKESDETRAPSEDLARDVEYQNQMAKLLLDSKKPDGTLDLNVLMGKLHAPGS
jgi:hypothetical protein